MMALPFYLLAHIVELREQQSPREWKVRLLWEAQALGHTAPVVALLAMHMNNRNPTNPDPAELFAIRMRAVTRHP